MAAPTAASCMNTENGCVMFDCLVHLWEWIDPPMPQNHNTMDNKKNLPATQQPMTQQHVMSHHGHPTEQIYSHQHHQMTTQLTSPQPQIQPNGVMHQLLQSQYQSNMNPRSPLLENRHELYGTSHNAEYARHYGTNDNYNYPQSPQRTEIYPDHNVNHELQNIPKGYNAEVYQDYLKRNPPKDTNQIYQNHQPMYRPNANQYGSKPYLPYSNRIGPQSNTELLRRQYNEIQQMKLQQQIHYQNQAQMQQQQTFAERQLLLQQMHGIQPPSNLQNSIYSDESYRDLDRYGSRNDFKDQLSSPDIQKEVDRFIKNNELKEIEKQNRQYLESHYQTNQLDYRDYDHYRGNLMESDKSPTSPPEFANYQVQKSNVGVVSPIKSSESSSPSVKSPSSESRRSSGGQQALRSPIAQRAPSAPVTLSGILYKQGSDGLKVWRKRWFVLSEYCLFYYKSQEEEKLLGSVLLPSYKVSACTAEDKVMRKFAFKLEHTNMRTYILAAPEQEAMLKWVKALTMAALMQNYKDDHQKTDRAAVKVEEDDEVPGPTYANAPPKPRRSNEGYSSPSPEMYDPNYDVKKPTSHVNHGTSHMRHSDHNTYPSSPNDNVYTRNPQSPPHQQQYQPKRPYDMHNLSLPLTNTISDRLENSPGDPMMYKTNPQSPYFDNRTRSQQQTKVPQDKIYERHNTQRNTFSQETLPVTDISSRDINLQNRNVKNVAIEQDVSNLQINQMKKPALNTDINVDGNYINRDTYGELNIRQPRSSNTAVNERLLAERRTPDAYGRSIASQDRTKVGDYEDVYSSYLKENEYGRQYSKPTSPPQGQDSTHSQIQSFSGPAILRRKKMQSSGIQPPVPRPHSADFLEYESRNELLNKSLAARTPQDTSRQPQRPKSSLDINSYYDPSSDRYYSEESYAAKMRQSTQYLQHEKFGPKNIQIPLAKYASGLAEKQLHSPYAQNTNNNYETEFGLSRRNRDNISYNSKHSENDSMGSNWMLKEKNENKKEYLNRRGSVMSDSSTTNGFVKDASRYEPATNDGFIRSASARLPSSVVEKEGEKKVQQREESMKRLLEWKQRMLHSPLTRKSTHAGIYLAISSNQKLKGVDQHKNKNYSNASYNPYSSDDEDQDTGNDLHNARTKQAGRSERENLPSPKIIQADISHKPPLPLDKIDGITKDKAIEDIIKINENLQTDENLYENMECCPIENSVIDENVQDISVNLSDSAPILNKDKLDEHFCDDESEDSEAESEKEMEYTDDDLDEVLLDAEEETKNDVASNSSKTLCTEKELNSEPNFKSETPPIKSSEDHYLPMSPRKVSKSEPAHQTIIKSLDTLELSLIHYSEDNPYVEMNLGHEDDDTRNYEIVCVNNGKVEPVYMELSNVSSTSVSTNEKGNVKNKSLSDTASNFADTKEHTLKRASKNRKSHKKECCNKSKHTTRKSSSNVSHSDCSDADDEESKDISLDTPFNRFSISDTFRPASYYLIGSRSTSDIQDSSDSEVMCTAHASSSSPPELSEEALSKYVLEKLDKSNLAQDNSILKMLTNETQSTAKRKTTSLMIHGSKTSLHDTLTRGEKIRNNRACLSSNSNITELQTTLVSTSLLEHYNSNRSIETDSLLSYNADRGSSRLSLESDISSNKFEMAQSNISSDVASLNESDTAIELRRPIDCRNLEMIMKRRPLSDDSFFELEESTEDKMSNFDQGNNVNLDKYLNTLQQEPLPNRNTADDSHCIEQPCNVQSTSGSGNVKDNVVRAANLQSSTHVRCSSTPASKTSDLPMEGRFKSMERRPKTIYDHNSGYTGSQSSCSSVGTSKPSISYYSKSYERKSPNKNINNVVLSDKIREFEGEKNTSGSGNDANASCSTTGFHSRESSNEHSAPYYYSDLSSQEHLNLLPTSHYLKNTNLHRKLNNQRRRGPLNKKNEISHIHNPIHGSSSLLLNDVELSAAARSVSVEFLCAADKDPEIDMKNIYESTIMKESKIPESMSSLMSTFGCKNNSHNNFTEELANNDKSSLNLLRRSDPIPQPQVVVDKACPQSDSSTSTFHLDNPRDARAYENVMCQGDKVWDEDSLWRDNLRRASHRHARSMDDLDVLPNDIPTSSITVCGMNSLKHNKKQASKKITRNVTYVNTDFQNQIVNRFTNETNSVSQDRVETDEKSGENDVYVSLAENSDPVQEQSDEGVYEQLALENAERKYLEKESENQGDYQRKNKKKFEIDREKLRQWDLMSSGLMKGGAVLMRGGGAGLGELFCSTDSGADSASNEASLAMSGAHLELNSINSPSTSQHVLPKKSFLGSNTSIGRANRDRDTNIPVRAVSPRVRWVEDKTSNEHYGSQQITASQQNLNALSTTEDSWATIRSPSRASQQPIRAVSPRVRRNSETDEMIGHNTGSQISRQRLGISGEIPTAGELLGRTHEELVLLLIQLRRRHAATSRAIDQCCTQISSIEDCMSSLKSIEREESLQRLEQLKMQLMELEHQYQKSRPLVQLVDNMVKLGSLYNRPGSTVERLERNQRLREKVLAEHAIEQQRWLESAAAGKSLETEAARSRVAELWALEQELADEAAILQGMKTDKDAIETLLTGVRSKFGSMQIETASRGEQDLEAELARVHAMLALNSKKLEQTVADNSRLERELMQLRRALHTQRQSPAPAHAPSAATALLEDEVSRVQHLVAALQRQRQELSRAVRHLTQQSRALQISQHSLPGANKKRLPSSSWQETNLDTGHTTDHGQCDYDYEMPTPMMQAGHYDHSQLNTPLYVDTHESGVADMTVTSPLSDDMQSSGIGNLSNVEKQEIKTVRIVKRESERRQRDRERSLQPMSDWPSSNPSMNFDQFLEEELITPTNNYSRSTTIPRTDFSKFEEYYSKPLVNETNYAMVTSNMSSSMEISPKYPSSPSLSNYDFSKEISSLSSSYNRSYDRSGYDSRTMSYSNQYLNSPDSSRTLTNDPLSKTSSINSLTRSHAELSPIFKSEAAKQIITEMSGDNLKNGSLHRRQVPKEKRRHYTAPHHLSAKTLNELPNDSFNQDKLGRSLDDTDMERALRAPPDVVRSAIAPQRYAENTIDQLLAAPQKIVIPERYIPEKPPELSPEEQQKRQEKVESIKKMLSSSSADPSKSPDGEDKKQREHLLQMNQILAKQVMEMSKIVAVKALEELPYECNGELDLDDRSPDVELPIYQQRDNFFT